MQPRDERGEGKDAEEYPFVFRAGLFEPGRNHGYDKVDTDERVHEPQMTAPKREVEGHHLQLLDSFIPCQFAPSGWQYGIQHQEADEGRQDAQETTMIELDHRHPRLHRHQQEGRDYHKQRHGYAPEETVIDRYPKTVVLIDYLGYRSHIIKLFTGMYYHYQQAGNHTDVIYKCYSVFHIHPNS